MILFITSSETDYLQDLTFSGLSEVLGKESIVDYPTHWQYHRRKKHFWSSGIVYPKNLGLVSLNGYSNTSESQTQRMIDHNDFDLIILGSVKPDALIVLSEVLEKVSCPWIMIDGGDWKEIGGDFKRIGGEETYNFFKSICRKKEPLVVFKREMKANTSLVNVVPFAFSINLNHVPPIQVSEKKNYQVVFWAVESSEVRKRVFKMLNGRFDCAQNGTVSGQTFRGYSNQGDSYFRNLARSKIGLSFRGEGFDTLRYWEVPVCQSLLISEKPIIEIPNNFTHKRHAIFCKEDCSDLCSWIEYYLLHEAEARDIAAAGYQHLLKFHTHIKRAEMLIEILKSRYQIDFKSRISPLN